MHWNPSLRPQGRGPQAPTVGNFPQRLRGQSCFSPRPLHIQECVCVWGGACLRGASSQAQKQGKCLLPRRTSFFPGPRLQQMSLCVLSSPLARTPRASLPAGCSFTLTLPPPRSPSRAASLRVCFASALAFVFLCRPGECWTGLDSRRAGPAWLVGGAATSRISDSSCHKWALLSPAAGQPESCLISIRARGLAVHHVSRPLASNPILLLRPPSSLLRPPSSLLRPLSSLLHPPSSLFCQLSPCSTHPAPAPPAVLPAPPTVLPAPPAVLLLPLVILPALLFIVFACVLCQYINTEIF